MTASRTGSIEGFLVFLEYNVVMVVCKATPANQ